MKRHFTDEAELARFGEMLGGRLVGGEVLELVGDVGAGKTTLTKSIARGMGIDGPIHSPTFTISNRYESPNGRILAHYDFYRLNDAGLMNDELAETVNDARTVTVVEWADIVSGVLPEDRVTIHLTPVNDMARDIEIVARGTNVQLFEEVR